MASQSQADAGSSETPLKSRRSDKFSFATFVSRTHRKVDIFWVNFKGGRVLYKTLRHFGESYSITTFESHPWIFRDHETGDILVANNNEMAYYPVPWTAGQQHMVQNVVFIDLPVYTLRDRCIQVVRQHQSADEFQESEVPREVIGDLKKLEDVPHKIYIPL